jgi:hypothetical protein
VRRIGGEQLGQYEQVEVRSDDIVAAAAGEGRFDVLPFPAAQVAVASGQGTIAAIALDRELLLDDLRLPG